MLLSHLSRAYRWVSVLKGIGYNIRVSNSVMAIFAKNESTRNNLKSEMKKRGIDEKRLIFSESLPRLEYLARNKVVDLFLDTFPYNAGTTASDSLRMGNIW